MYSKMTAYRKKHSCETALISWVEDWRLALDNKQKALLLSMDMSKAFDLVLPSLTVAKVDAYGFNDKSLQLILFIYLFIYYRFTPLHNKQ